ncbi:MAG: palindromic element RPE5 domain-containing protein [Rickettsia sp.]|uniref:palindromic element RPE5 domain-containing protein n=1 Tax=Rickettsia sp. TaxID=789 RepID=UPI003978156D
MTNNKLTKKYYSASEVIKHLNIALHQLRYLETKIPDLSNYKINNRKYYTANDIELLQKSCYKTSYTKINLKKSNEPVSRGAERIIIREHPRTYKDIVANFSSSSSRIDILLTNFHNLSLQIKKILADSSMTCV